MVGLQTLLVDDHYLISIRVDRNLAWLLNMSAEFSDIDPLEEIFTNASRELVERLGLRLTRPNVIASPFEESCALVFENCQNRRVGEAARSRSSSEKFTPEISIHYRKKSENSFEMALAIQITPLHLHPNDPLSFKSFSSVVEARQYVHNRTPVVSRSDLESLFTSGKTETAVVFGKSALDLIEPYFRNSMIIKDVADTYIASIITPQTEAVLREFFDVLKPHSLAAIPDEPNSYYVKEYYHGYVPRDPKGVPLIELSKDRMEKATAVMQVLAYQFGMLIDDPTLLVLDIPYSREFVPKELVDLWRLDETPLERNPLPFSVGQQFSRARFLADNLSKYGHDSHGPYEFMQELAEEFLSPPKARIVREWATCSR